MDGYDFIFEHYEIKEMDFVPNTIEDFHDTKKVQICLLELDLSLMTGRFSGITTDGFWS